MMKILILFSLIAFSAASTSDELAAVRQRCIAQSQVNPERVQNLKHGVFYDDDQTLRAYTGCFLVSVGALTPTNGINTVVIKKLLTGSDQELDQLLSQCAVQRDTVPDTAYEMYKCMYNINPRSLPK